MKKVLFLVLVSLLLSLTVVADSLPVHNIDSGRVMAQAASTTTVYLDPPTINGTVEGEEFTVNIMIRDAHNIYAWQAGLTFNPDLLKCTGLSEGKFLSDVEGPDRTRWIKGIINNTAGTVWPPSACTLLGEVLGASGSGILANATFKVKAPGVSNIHLSDVRMLDYPDLNSVPVNIIDVYTVVSDTTPHTVVTVSNLTGSGKAVYGCCFYDHAFSQPAEKISFKVAGPNEITQKKGMLEVSGSFSNVTIPKTLLSVSTLDQWRVKIDGKLLTTEERIVTENATHYSIYFTYSAGFHFVQITTRPLINSVISITTSLTNYTAGSDITISGAINPVRPNAPVTIYNRTKGDVEWDTLATLKTDSNSHYSYTWTPEKNGTYQFMAMWEGDDDTFGDVSGVLTLKVPTYVFVFEVEGFQAIIQTDSTISAFNFSQPSKQISFNVTGPEGKTVFCNITIPKTFMWVDALDEWNITIDGTPLSTQEKIVTFNGTHYFIHFTCNTSTVTIQVISKYVIPEFPTWTSMLLILILLTVAIAITKRRLLKTLIR